MSRIPISILALAFTAAASAQSVIPNSGTGGTIAIRNGTIHTVTGPVIERGHLVIVDGRIAAITTDGSAIPSGARSIDATGLHVYPGLIDSGTNVGLTEISSVAGSVDVSETGELNPNARVAVALNPHSEVIPVTRVNGVTSAVVFPEGGVVSGQDALINLSGWTPAEMVLRAPVGMHINFPQLRTGGWGAQPEGEEGEKELTKTYERSLEDLRKLFRDARAYSKASGARTSASSLPRLERDIVLESMMDVIGGRIPIVVHADYAADIRGAAAFAKEFDLRMILSGGKHVQDVLDVVKGGDIAVILGPILSLPLREDDPYDLVFSNAAALHREGIPFAIQTADSHNSRNLPYHAAAAAAFGLPKEEALKAITIYPARILGVDAEIGSLEVGKLANVIVTDGDPLEIRTHVRHLFIEGQELPLDSRHTLLWKKFEARP